MMQVTNEEENLKKIQEEIIQLNRKGLKFLNSDKFDEAITEFRQAQKTITTQLHLNPKNILLNKLTGITYNNLACYYKKKNKPKVALTYLKKALELQVYKVLDWVSTASTHLNICAIYSFMNKHQQALDHVAISIALIEKIKVSKNEKQISSQQQKLFNNVNILAHYNHAIELEHLKKNEQSKSEYEKTIELANANGKKYQQIINSSNSALKRLQNELKISRQKLVEIITRRQQKETKGNYQFMRRNKKNFRNPNDTEWNVGTLRKYQLYKDTSPKKSQNKNYASVDKIRKLQPINLKKDKQKASNTAVVTKEKI